MVLELLDKEYLWDNNEKVLSETGIIDSIGSIHR